MVLMSKFNVVDCLVQELWTCMPSKIGRTFTNVDSVWLWKFSECAETAVWEKVWK